MPRLPTADDDREWPQSLELQQWRRLVEERTADLHRVKAEYDPYRKRLRRDRMAVREIAVANVLRALLPVPSFGEAGARLSRRPDIRGGHRAGSIAAHALGRLHRRSPGQEPLSPDRFIRQPRGRSCRPHGPVRWCPSRGRGIHPRA